MEKKIKVLIVSTAEYGIAPNRLYKALNKDARIQCKMLVRDKKSADPDVHTVNKNLFCSLLNKLRFYAERLSICFRNNFSKEKLFEVSIANTGNDITHHPLVKEADIIHLHWINQGFLSLKNIVDLLKTGKPIVWTMHDQWSYTGVCHYTSGCGKFQKQCSQCPKLGSSKLKDLSYKIQDKKKKIMQYSNIYFVGCSNWNAKEAEKSFIYKKEAFSIPNPINIDLFKPKDKPLLKEKYGLEQGKKYILFGAARLDDKRKGTIYFIEAMNMLNNQERDDCEVLLFGKRSTELESQIKLKTHYIGYVDGDAKMAELYNLADVFVIPSLEDNLPNTIMEAMTCGVPCVGFDVGGIPEMIDHKINGYVAEYKNSTDLFHGIKQVIGELDYTFLSFNAREKSEAFYSEKVVSKLHFELYNMLLLNNIKSQRNEKQQL